MKEWIGFGLLMVIYVGMLRFIVLNEIKRRGERG